MYGKKLVSVLVLVAVLFVMCAGVVNAEKPSYNGAEHGNGRPPSHANAGGRGDKWNNDPDDDGRGPDRGDGSVDDWDWNNGCGNDPDRDDDNEGWCGRPKSVQPTEPTKTRKREAKTCNLVLWGETPEVFDATIDVWNPTNEQFVIAEEVLKEIRERLQFLMNVGLHYLTLDRAAPSLSGGEGQRIRLASQIGCGLVGVLYVLDEPSIGLHSRDNRRLLETLERLRDMGNTVVVVEHDEQTIRTADWILDLGPGAGINGGLAPA